MSSGKPTFGVRSAIRTVRSSSFLERLRSMYSIDAAPVFGSFGSVMRRRENNTSSAVTGLPSWNVAPSRRRTVHESGLAPASIDSASSISSSYSGLRIASGS
jgi:hypothetical protein